jgi:hypothetical protein
MITEQKSTSQWQQALVENWKGCASVRITLEQIRPGDVILAQYTRPRRADSPPPEYIDSKTIFVVLHRPGESCGRDITALEIVRLSPVGELLGSMSWGITTLPEGSTLWLLGSSSGARIPDARWLELSLSRDTPMQA